MALEKYLGYPATLRTSLSPEECRRRLAAEFGDTRRRWRARGTASDDSLSGTLRGRTLTIAPWRARYREAALGVNNLNRVRAFRARLMPHGDGTLIRGAYGYGAEVLLLDWAMVGIAAFIALAFLGSGASALAAGDREGWLLLVIGLLIVSGIVIFLVQSVEQQFLRERDHILAYLERVLDAERTGG